MILINNLDCIFILSSPVNQKLIRGGLVNPYKIIDYVKLKDYESASIDY